MRVMETYQQRPDCDIVCFAEVVTRDPFLLMGRAPRPDFTLADLKSVRLATVSEVPTPWLCLQHDLRLAGIDPAGIARVADQTMAANVAALKAGEVDVIQVFEPFPSLLLAEGAAHVWYAAARRGPTSYTTFYARRGLLTSRRDELQRMTRAIHRTEKWVAKASGREIAQAISGYFGDLPPAILEAACTRYKALGIWAIRRCCRAPVTTGCATVWCRAASSLPGPLSRPQSTIRSPLPWSPSSYRRSTEFSDAPPAPCRADR